MFHQNTIYKNTCLIFLEWLFFFFFKKLQIYEDYLQNNLVHPYKDVGLMGLKCVIAVTFNGPLKLGLSLSLALNRSHFPEDPPSSKLKNHGVSVVSLDLRTFIHCFNLQKAPTTFFFFFSIAASFSLSPTKP